MTTTQITARLVPNVDEHAENVPGSWFITHPLGSPARGTFTEVAFTTSILDGLKEARPNEDEREAVLAVAVRQAAVALYGTAWAFSYRPEQYADSIEKYGMRRRERVIVTEITTW